MKYIPDYLYKSNKLTKEYKELLSSGNKSDLDEFIKVHGIPVYINYAAIKRIAKVIRKYDNEQELKGLVYRPYKDKISFTDLVMSVFMAAKACADNASYEIAHKKAEDDLTNETIIRFNHEWFDTCTPVGGKVGKTTIDKYIFQDLFGDIFRFRDGAWFRAGEKKQECTDYCRTELLADLLAGEDEIFWYVNPKEDKLFKQYKKWDDNVKHQFLTLVCYSLDNKIRNAIIQLKDRFASRRSLRYFAKSQPEFMSHFGITVVSWELMTDEQRYQWVSSRINLFISALNIDKGDLRSICHYVYDGYSRRLHTIFTRTPSWLRLSYSYAGEEVVEIDAPYSQITLLISTYEGKLGKESRISEEISKTNHKDFYKLIMTYLSEDGMDLTRKEVKLAVLNYIYTNVLECNRVIPKPVLASIDQALRLIDPEFVEYIDSYKNQESGKSRLPYIMQSKEVTLFTEIWAKLRDENIPYASIHDAVSVPLSYSERVKEIMHEVYDKQGVRLLAEFHVERLSA